jgi:hypothetical protein
MQLVRQREHAPDVHQLLLEVPAAYTLVTDLSVHSIALAMRKHKMLDQLPAFIASSSIGNSIAVVGIPPNDLAAVVQAVKSLRLDFDDAYQYVAAELNDLTLVSLDADFDRTPRGRLTPAAALRLFTDEQQQPQQEA